MSAPCTGSDFGIWDGRRSIDELALGANFDPQAGPEWDEHLDPVSARYDDTRTGISVHLAGNIVFSISCTESFRRGRDGINLIGLPVAEAVRELGVEFSPCSVAPESILCSDLLGLELYLGADARVWLVALSDSDLLSD